jgi:hypothetical protein
MIREFKSKDIDRERWDAIVSKDPMAKVYSMSWFLDAVTGNDWRALILNDYEALMPFAVRKKWGVQYCYMPFVAQQFSILGDAEGIEDRFIETLRMNYAYGQIALAGNVNLSGIDILQRNNYELVLDKPYPLFSQHYSKNHKMNLARFFKRNLEIKSSNEIKPLLTLFKEEKSFVMTAKAMHGALKNIETLYQISKTKGCIDLYYALTSEGIVGGVFVLRNEGRLYYLLGSSKKKNKAYQSVLYGLIDHVIKKYADTSLVLDFEGSDIESIGYFFKGFNAMNNKYFSLRWNDLPFYVKWLKK